MKRIIAFILTMVFVAGLGSLYGAGSVYADSGYGYYCSYEEAYLDYGYEEAYLDYGYGYEEAYLDYEIDPEAYTVISIYWPIRFDSDPPPKPGNAWRIPFWVQGFVLPPFTGAQPGDAYECLTTQLYYIKRDIVSANVQFREICEPFEIDQTCCSQPHPIYAITNVTMRSGVRTTVTNIICFNCGETLLTL